MGGRSSELFDTSFSHSQRSQIDTCDELDDSVHAGGAVGFHAAEEGVGSEALDEEDVGGEVRGRGLDDEVDEDREDEIGGGGGGAGSGSG